MGRGPQAHPVTNPAVDNVGTVRMVECGLGQLAEWISRMGSLRIEKLGWSHLARASPIVRTTQRADRCMRPVRPDTTRLSLSR